MRLWEAITGRALSLPVEGPYQWMSTAFGQPDNEAILPGYYNAGEAYKNSGVVFGVVLARLSLFSEAEFKFQRKRDKSLYGTEELRILEEPWQNGSTAELLARMEQDVSMAGNAYIRRAGDQLERLRPDCVTIVSELSSDGGRVVIGYVYDVTAIDRDRGTEFYPVDEVAHWSPIPDPQANFRGMSWMSTVLREINADQSMTDYKRAYLENAATPNLLIKYQRKIPQSAIDRLSEQMRARHGGVGNAFKTLVLDEGADASAIGNTFNQMTFAAVQAAGENRIAVAAGVPAIVAGLKEGLEAATYSNYGLAMRRFADLTMRPNWRSACAALSRLVDVPEDSRLWFDTTDIAALQEGEKEQADTMSVLATAAASFIAAGYEPASVQSALAASDITLLKHTGLMSVQLQPPGSQTEEPPPPDASAEDPDPEEGDAA